MRPEALHGGAGEAGSGSGGDASTDDKHTRAPASCSGVASVFLRKTLLRPCAVALHLLAPYSLVYGVIELFRSDIVTNWQSLFGLPNFVELCLRQTVGRQ